MFSINDYDTNALNERVLSLYDYEVQMILTVVNSLANMRNWQEYSDTVQRDTIDALVSDLIDKLMKSGIEDNKMQLLHDVDLENMSEIELAVSDYHHYVIQTELHQPASYQTLLTLNNDVSMLYFHSSDGGGLSVTSTLPIATASQVSTVSRPSENNILISDASLCGYLNHTFYGHSVSMDALGMDRRNFAGYVNTAVTITSIKINAQFLTYSEHSHMKIFGISE